MPLYIILISLLFSAFFSGMEIAFLTSNRLRIELDKKQGLFSSKIISKFVKNPGKYLTTMLIGNNIALVVYGIVMADLLRPEIERYMQNEVGILVLQTLISTFFILVTAEFLPKTIFRSIANPALNILAVPLLIFYVLFYPISYLINQLSSLIIKSVDKKTKKVSADSEVFNKIDLMFLLNQAKDGENEDTEDEAELKLFQNALDFSSVKIRDCMVPRTEIIAVDRNSSPEHIKQEFIESGFSKIPVYQETIDDIIGYVTSKSLFKNPNQALDHLFDVSFVPEAMPANKLLKSFIREKKSIAIVVDEFGGVSGMLTIEDILEEIFGEIEDEHDQVQLIEKQISETEFIFAGRHEIDYINDQYKIGLPVSEEYETLAGFIIHNFESIPKLNQRIQIGAFSIKILKVSSTKIDLIHLKIDQEN